MPMIEISDECLAQIEFLKDLYSLSDATEVVEYLVDEDKLRNEVSKASRRDVHEVIETVLDPNISIAEVVVTMGESLDMPPLSFDEILAITPNDPVVKDAKDDPDSRKAVELVYARLGAVDWGTPLARGMVDGIVKKLKLSAPIDSGQEPN